ncbi:cytochrome c oxidase subunit II [Natronomonas salina]|uniref:cytochrome c oxidase subunit II n=1 Tax=Natronomonas salina TaxID=1710540 RepID=UPI001BA870B6|nr:cytochrome c oxidase subunit II [Natronomonas salina]
MRVTRLATAALGGFLLLALAADPVLAQSRNANLINDLNTTLLYAAVPITILVEGILIYTVLKYRNNDEPTPTQENRRLEITWTVATAIVLLFVGFASYQVLAVEVVGDPVPGEDRIEPTVSEDFEGAVGPKETEDNAVELEVQAFTYGWETTYEGTNVTTNNQIRIPTDRPVYLHITSRDWLHMLHQPDLGLKQQAQPGQYNTIKTVAYEEGSHQFYCTEYCGVGHSQMNGEFIVMSGDDYDQWLQEQQQAEQQEGEGGGSGGQQNGTNDQQNSTGGTQNQTGGTQNETAGGSGGQQNGTAGQQNATGAQQNETEA